MTAITPIVPVDPFALVAAVRTTAEISAIVPSVTARQSAEIVRLVAAGDVFGAGLVLAMAMGTPLVDPAALTI